MPDYEILGMDHRGTRLEGFPLESIFKMVKIAHSVFYYYLSCLRENDGYNSIRNGYRRSVYLYAMKATISS